MASKTPKYHTAGKMALRLGVAHFHLTRLIKKGLIPFTPANPYALLDEADEPRIREILIERGLIKARDGTHFKST